MDDPRPNRRIAAAVAARIGAGSEGYRPGDRVDVGLLADEFDTTRTTVGKAMKVLQSEGLIAMFEGLGWYVTGAAAE